MPKENRRNNALMSLRKQRYDIHNQRTLNYLAEPEYLCFFFYTNPEKYGLPTCNTCGNTHFSPAARYCKICGTEVTHFTTRGILRIVYSKLADGINKCQSDHENDRNARYCEFCGEPTSAYEVLPDWQV